MESNALLAALEGHRAFVEAREMLSGAGAPTILASEAVDPAKWHIAAGLLRARRRPALVVTHSELKSRQIYDDLSYFLREPPALYPSRDLLFFSADVKSADITRERIKTLGLLEKGGAPVVILSSEALLDRMPQPEAFFARKLGMRVGDVCEPGVLAKKLAGMGYSRSGLAEGPGQFALRGGIVDLCPIVGEFFCPAPHSLAEGQALRVEFFGDQVDSVRLVDAHSQRSLENGDGFTVYPVREFVFGKGEVAAAAAKIRDSLESQKHKLLGMKMRKEAAELEAQVMAAISDWDGEISPQADAFAPFFCGGQEWSITDYLPPGSLIFFDEPGKICAHMEAVQAEFRESAFHRLEAGRLLPEQTGLICAWESARAKCGRFPLVLLAALAEGFPEFAGATRLSFSSRQSLPLRTSPAELKNGMEAYVKKGYRLVVLAGSRRQGEHLAASLGEMDVPARFADSLESAKIGANMVTVSRGTLSAGFEYPDIGFALVTDKELFGAGTGRKRRRRRHKGAEKISHFSDLRAGDLIVHDNHGIGVFRGIEQVTSDGNTRDYLKIEYEGGGNLYVQTSQMDLIHKYVGGENAKLSKLGGGEWARAKARARQAIEILASDLIALYAKRESAKRREYGPDTVWQAEFEAQFPYAETDDQLAAIEDVKRDMESGRLMDRLICGDVGFGKTEVAIRAAFKAVQDGKQVAYLVPTTILAEQHYQTFARRLDAYPVKVERLSRYLTKKEQAAALERLSKGQSDIVIGTHRLLSKDVRFKDLGLVVIDEEQRFGVSHKEKLKRLKDSVDVLTLTATPIPRTLHFSLTGIRDMSLLNEPPEERQPIQTYVMEYSQEFVRDAISRELARGGQVYYLHNRVINIPEEAARVAALVPQANVAYAHGQMGAIELENIMHDFVDGDIDVLVCTTIIETGLDIPNVNTIIIGQADFFGLSQLYQLRGRVGRSNRLAYAYLMYRKDKILTEEAEKRLQTIREFTEFGAGFKIAMRDLEIRGAGNLLGAQQHGHIDTIGYDLYMKLLSEAVRVQKGEPAREDFETSIEIKIDAHIPASLVPDEQQRLEIYKKISLATNEQDASDIRDEVLDRYGKLPQPVENLIGVALMKAEAMRLGITGVSQKGDNIVLSFLPNADVDVERLTKILTENPARYLFTMGGAPHLTIRRHGEDAKPKNGGSDKVAAVRELLGRLSQGPAPGASGN